MRKRQRQWTAAALLLVLTLAAAWGLAHPKSRAVQRMHEKQLQRAVLAVNRESVTLDEVVPFAWDTVQAFPPYTSEETIRQTLGVKGGSIPESFSEGMQLLIFVKGDRVAAAVCGYAETLGYAVEINETVRFGEGVPFRVVRDGNLVVLTQMQPE